MLSPICPSCKSPVEVPADHFEATIRCGICWAEVIVERPVMETSEPVADAVELRPAEAGIPIRAFVGKPAKGMEPLEVLLAGVAEKLPHLYTAPEAVAVEDVVAEAPPPKRVVAKRREEEGLRRKRGTESRMTSREQAGEPATNSVAKLALLLLVAAVVAIAGYFVMR